jgi:hypothetical protein
MRALTWILFLVCVPAGAAPKLRLPTDARPTRYALDLTVVPSQAPFRGIVTIDLDVAVATSQLWLDATGLVVDGAELRAAGATQKARVVAGGEDFVGFQLARAVAPGPAQLVVRYRDDGQREEPRALSRRRRTRCRRLVRLHFLRAGRRASRLSLLRRAVAQGAVAADAARTEGSRGAGQR